MNVPGSPFTAHLFLLRLFFFLKKTKSCFRFTAKLRGKYRSFPYTSYSHISIASCIINIPLKTDTFVTIDEPTLTHRNHPKATVSMWRFIFGAIHSMNLNNLKWHVSSLWYHTEYFHCLKNPLWCIYLSLLEPLTGTDIFPVSIVLHFPECHIVVIIQYVVFSDWLLSLSNMHLRFIHGFSLLNSSFLVTTDNIPVSGICPFIYWRTSLLLPSSGNYD